MSNVFKKLIRKELGEAEYRRYSSYVKKNMETKISNSKTIYEDMYEKLQSRDIKSIAKMHNRLNDTMLLAFRISKNFFLAFLFYLSASVFLIAKDLQPLLTMMALISISACFVYKAYEYITNKFCYIDAQLILVYKAVLDKIILNERKGIRDK